MSRKHSYKRYYSVVDQDEYEASRKRSGSFDQHSENEGNYAFDVFDDLTANIQHKHKNRRRRSQGDINDPACEQLMLTTDLSEPANDVIRDSKKNRLIVFPTLRACSIKKKRCMVVFGLGVVLGIAFGILLGHLACKNNQGTSRKGQNITRNLSAESYAYRQPPGNEKPKVDKCVLEQWSDVFIPNTTLIKNRCDFGSAFVKEYCNEDKSRHRCQQCGKYMIPKSCFCDTEIQCNYNGFKADNPIKKTCGECRKELNCPCINGGNCTCNDETATADTIHCECPRGHTGQYCDVTIQTEVRYRICAPSTNNAETICDGAEIDACTIFSTYFNQNITCVTTKDEFEIKKLKKCS